MRHRTDFFASDWDVVTCKTCLSNRHEPKAFEKIIDMQPFRLNRKVDHSGIAGTGVVAEGVQFTSGLCVLSWLTAPVGMDRVPAGVGVYESIGHVEAVHGHGGDTVVEWVSTP